MVGGEKVNWLCSEADPGALIGEKLRTEEATKQQNFNDSGIFPSPKWMLHAEDVLFLPSSKLRGFEGLSASAFALGNSVISNPKRIDQTHHASLCVAEQFGLLCV